MRYHNITKVDMLNGSGIRVVLWVAGCEWHCKDCQNPITWDPNGGLFFDNAARCELMDALKEDYISGVTFSGGDPLHPENRATIMQLISDIREVYGDTKTIWLYTGYKYEDIAYLVRHIDVVVDGPFDYQLADKKYHWAGSTNQRVIDVKRTIQEGKVVLYEDH